jgi:hypothetical protein
MKVQILPRGPVLHDAPIKKIKTKCKVHNQKHTLSFSDTISFSENWRKLLVMQEEIVYNPPNTSAVSRLTSEDSIRALQRAF